MKLSNRVLKMEESVTLATAARAKALKAQGRDILSLTLSCNLDVVFFPTQLQL